MTDLGGSPINDWHGLAGVINEQLLAGTVFLAHDHIDVRGAAAAVLADQSAQRAM